MIKGIQKNIIVIKDPGSHIFEQAIFIVKKRFAAFIGYHITL